MTTVPRNKETHVSKRMSRTRSNDVVMAERENRWRQSFERIGCVRDMNNVLGRVNNNFRNDSVYFEFNRFESRRKSAPIAMLTKRRVIINVNSMIIVYSTVVRRVQNESIYLAESSTRAMYLFGTIQSSRYERDRSGTTLILSPR